MALNDQILDELKKALDKVQATTATRQAWQEQFDRYPVVTPEHIQAAKALEGFAGSWAAQAILAPNTDELLTYAQGDGIFSPQLVASHLGRPGVPESNFPLYARGTNKDDEPAFLGHPISFSIVGATLRHKTTNWQWVYAYDAALGEESLTLSATAYNGGTPVATTIEEAYGITTLPSEGLYFVVSQTGSPANIDTGALVQGGVGDGYVSGGLPLSEKKNSGTGELLRAARYEIFRVLRIDGTDTLVLDKAKRMSDYFDMPVAPPVLVRGITLFKPYVTRLMAIPSPEGAGKNKVFLTLTPEVSANDDLYPAYGAGSTSGSTWRGGGVADYDEALEGWPAAYNGQAKLPVYTPKGEGTGRIQTNRYKDPDPAAADGLSFEAGVLKISDYTGSVSVGDVICIHNVSQMNSDYGTMHTVYEAFNASRGKHYYEVLSLEAIGGLTYLRCKALPQVDANGNIFYGPVVMDATIDLDGTPVQATGGVRVANNAGGAGETYEIRIANERNNTDSTYTYTTIGADTPATIATGLVTAINAGAGDPNVLASANPPVFPATDWTVLLTAKAPPATGPVGNAIQFFVGGTNAADMYVSGSRLGTSVGADPLYAAGTSGLAPVLGHGIGPDQYFLQAHYTIHDNVSALHTDPTFDAAKVQKNRLANLIDPTWARNTLSKLQSVVGSQVAVSAGRADKAIFDTTVGPKGAANPGSLLDLGFRMVLFPAKEDPFTLDAVPDFDKPIATQNVILDPSINEAQYLYIDYASGAVVCSHTPDPNSPRCTLAPNGIVGIFTNNPRRDIVLFAACVPFSRLPDQTSGGLRFLSTQMTPIPYMTDNTVGYIVGDAGSQDILGGRTTRMVAGRYNGVDQTLQSQISNQVVYLQENDVIAHGSTLQNAGIPTINVVATVPGDTLTFYLGSPVYTGSLAAIAVGPAGFGQFVIGGGPVATAVNIADAINNCPRLSQFLYAAVRTGFPWVYVYTRRVGQQVDTSSFFPFTYTKNDPFYIYSNVPANLVLPEGGGAYAYLRADSYESNLPQSGWFDVVEGGSYEPALRFTDPQNVLRRVATFSYRGKDLVWDATDNVLRTRLTNVFGGGALGDNINLSSAQYMLVLRKADVLPNDPQGNTGTPFQLDTTEGASARFSKVKFAQGSLNYANGLLTIDLSGDFVKKRGDTMSGALVIDIDPILNPSEVNKSGLASTGNGSGSGVVGTGGAGATAGNGVSGYGTQGTVSDGVGVYGEGARASDGVKGLSGALATTVGVRGIADTGTNASGVRGEGDGTGNGVVGQGGGFGAGVVGTGGTGGAAGIGVQGNAGVGSGASGGEFFGDGAGTGVAANGGAAGGAGVTATGGLNGVGVAAYGGANNGAGVEATGGAAGGIGVRATGGTTGAGVDALGARGIVAASNAIIDYPQGQLTAAGNTLPVNKAKGDLWFPTANGVGGEDWDGHLLIYDGSNYLDAYSAILSSHLLVAQRGGYKPIAGGAWAQGPTNLLAEQSDIPMAAPVAISSTTALFLGDVTVNTTVAHGLVAGDYVYIVGAADANLNNNLPANPPSWRVSSVLGMSFIIKPLAGVGGGAAGTVQKVAPHPMVYMQYNQTGGGAQQFRFEHSYHLPNSYKGLPTTPASAAITIYHSVNATGAGGAPNTSWQLGVARYRQGEAYPVVANALMSGNYIATSTYLQQIDVTVATLTASVLGATPFLPDDVITIFLNVTGTVNGTSWYVYDTSVYFSEAFYAKY